MRRNEISVAVVGLGGMGSAALYHLAQHRVRVTGVEQFGPAHARGSSHGRSRIIRQAYFEHENYVPLLRRSYELWEQLNSDAQEPLWALCGGLSIGDEDSALIAGALRAARTYGIDHETLSANETRARFPEYRMHGSEVAVYEPTIGAVFPERCVSEHLRAAMAAGAQARFGVSVTNIRVGDSIRLDLSDNTIIECDRVILTAGPWTAQFATFPIRVERNVQHWFSMDAQGAPKQIFMVQRPESPRLLYGFPDFGEGVKAAFHHSGEFLVDAQEHEDQTRPDEIETVRFALRQTLNAEIGAHVRSEPCMYSNTPDEHFIIGPLPESEDVITACGFSGHGFKFCPVVGEILAELAVDGKTSHDISLFDPRRFLTQTVPKA